MEKVIIINPINYGRSTFRPPFGLLTIATIFHRRGMEVIWIDADVLRDDKDKINRSLKENLNADLIAIGGLHTAYRYIKEFFEYLRGEKIRIPTLIGGRVAKTLDYLIWNRILNVDMICKQEGEYVVESICDNFPNMENILGIEYRRNGEIRRNEPAPVVRSLDELPPMKWDVLDKDVYFGNGIGYLLSSRGCPFACHFCRHPDDPSDKLYRIMSTGRLIDEIKHLITTYQLREIYLVDEHFLLKKRRVEEFCDAVKDLHIRWRCTTRADAIKEKDLDLLKKMRSVGCHAIYMGIESGCQAMLDRMNKKLKVKQIEEAVKLVRSAGMSVSATFIFGFPGETRETAMESVEWRLKMGFRGRYFYATPYPGTKLYDYFKQRYSLTLDDEEKWIVESPSIKKLSINLTDMSMEELRELDYECLKKLRVRAKKLRGIYGKLKGKILRSKTTMSIYRKIRKAWTKWWVVTLLHVGGVNYRKTKKIWTNWWSSNPEYAIATTSDKHIKRSKMIVDRYASILDDCRSFCELGVGTGRNIHYFHARFPDWHYCGNDISPDIHDIIRSIYPDLLDYAEITVADTLNYLKVCNDTDIMFTYGHLMHLPDAVIEEVCTLIASKMNRFILIHEGYPHKAGAKMKASYKHYRFERNYDNMFPGFILKHRQVEEHPTKLGLRHCLYLFERIGDQ